MKVLEHHTKNFLGGEKIMLYEDKYEVFAQNMMDLTQKMHPVVMFEGMIRTICAILENNILRSFMRYDFAQSVQFFDLRSSTAFFYVNEQGYKPLKLRAVVSDLKLQLQSFQPQTPKKKSPTQNRKMIKDPEDLDLIKALRNPKNWDLCEELSQEAEGMSTPSKEKKSLKLASKVKQPTTEFFDNEFEKMKLSPTFNPSPPPFMMMPQMNPEFAAFGEKISF